MLGLKSQSQLSAMVQYIVFISKQLLIDMQYIKKTVNKIISELHHTSMTS